LVLIFTIHYYTVHCYTVSAGYSATDLSTYVKYEFPFPTVSVLFTVFWGFDVN